MAGPKPFIAVDWGTTNRRAWRIAPDGEVEEAFEDAAGVTAVAAGQFAGEALRLRQRLGDLPMLLGGMIGSNRGWREVPYVACPADLGGIARAILWIDDRTGIVPGVCQSGKGKPDVMRGEEVQIFGAIASGAILGDAVACLPGTHSKWVRISGGRIASFATWMTGEVFALLRHHSILADQLAGTAQPGADFAEGVAASAHDDPLACLFRVRASALLGTGIKDAPSYVSGLLIGAEMRSGTALNPETTVYVIGRPDLDALYAAAAAQLECAAVIIDGAAAFRAGIRALIEELA